MQFQRMTFNGFIDYDMQGNIVPGLATPWEISTDSLTYAFQLRQDVNGMMAKRLPPRWPLETRSRLVWRTV